MEVVKGAVLLSPKQAKAIMLAAHKAEAARLRLAALLQEAGLNPNGVYHITPDGVVTPQ